MCECMCGVWCMYIRKPLICTYPCQLPSSIMLCLVGYSDRVSLSPELADWLSCLLSEFQASFCLHLTVWGLQTHAPCPCFIWLLGISLCFCERYFAKWPSLWFPPCPNMHMYTHKLCITQVFCQSGSRRMVSAAAPPPPTHTLLLASLGLSLGKRVFIFVSIPIYAHSSSLFPRRGICDDLESWARIPLINLRSKNSPL